MELPLDHFRLIGVSPSATPEEILRAFQLRLDKKPNDGFTFEVLTQRSELLRLTADLLTNAESRQEYENLVLNGASGLEVSSNREVAGLILLWESGLAKEAFKLARKALQPPQTPALGSSREADLTLLAALTSRDAAINEQNLRRYSSASDFLQEGIQILQRMGKLSELRKNLEDDLTSLLPYRILDLVSRDLSDYESHKKGILMLENFILKRGGLEGKNKSEYNKFLNQDEFDVFFQQIKQFLTVQEQVDLFLNLQKRGSIEAGFLAFLSLTAIGFSRRKPEKLFEARKILKGLNISEIDNMLLLGCLDLLLADVEQAETRFTNTSDTKIRDWFNNYPGEKLEAMCVYCENWLGNEVLNGYRDIDNDQIDLNSWFEDREIQEFIEKEEKKNNRYLMRATLQNFSQSLKKIGDEVDGFNPYKSINNNNSRSKLPLPGGSDIEGQLKEEVIPDPKLSKSKSVKFLEIFQDKFSEITVAFGKTLKNNLVFRKSSYSIYLYVFLILFGIGIGAGFLRNNLKNQTNPEINTEKNENNIENEEVVIMNSIKEEILIDSNLISNDMSNDDLDNSIIQPQRLRSSSPEISEIKTLISSWLYNKSQFLAGVKDINLSPIVKNELIRRLQEERNQDIKQNVLKDITTEILDIKFLSQTSSRIVVEVSLKYNERILKNGKLVSETSIEPFLKVKYILGFTNKSWKLVDYISGV